MRPALTVLLRQLLRTLWRAGYGMGMESFVGKRKPASDRRGSNVVEVVDGSYGRLHSEHVGDRAGLARDCSRKAPLAPD